MKMILPIQSLTSFLMKNFRHCLSANVKLTLLRCMTDKKHTKQEVHREIMMSAVQTAKNVVTSYKK
jgi:hypothetical protein